MSGTFLQQGDVRVVISPPGRGLTPEQLTDRLMERILRISVENAPAPLREQALAYQRQVRETVHQYITEAQRAERTTIYNHLLSQGHADVAEDLRRSIKKGF